MTNLGAGPADFIPLCVPHLAGKEWTYTKECLDSGWVSSVGSFVNKFERDLAAVVGTLHAVAVASGTAAIHTALMVAGVGANDEVLLPTLTFIAPANAIRYVGAWPVFIDAEPMHWQIDPSKLEDFLKLEAVRVGERVLNRRTNRRIAAILPVHVLGHPADMSEILRIAREWNLIVIEDATESLGSRHGSRATGAIGDIGCFSFNGNKIVTTGGGGMITTNNRVFAEKARYLTTQAKDNAVEFIHGAVGYNYRLTNLQAAVGCAQLELLPDILKNKRLIARRYDAAFQGIPGLGLPVEAAGRSTNWWLYTLRVDEAATGIGSRDILRRLDSLGIQTRPFWQPMHRSPAHRDCQFWAGQVADALWRDCLSLPCSAGLSEHSQQRVIDAILGIVRVSARRGVDTEVAAQPDSTQ